MTVKRLITMLPPLACVLALAASMAGCIKDNLDDCDVSHTFTVRAYDNSGAELAREDVTDVILYVFDGHRLFVERIDTHVGRTVTINAPQGEEVYLVAWGNLGSGLQNCTDPAVGDHKDACCIDLLPHPTRAASYSRPPDDLFRGEITVTRQEQGGNQELPIYREVGSLTVTVRNLKASAGFADNNYSIEVRETCSVIDFAGNCSGAKTAYRPTGSFVTNAGREEYFVPAFNLVPETGIHIDIYHGTDLVATVSEDNSGNPVTVEKGRLTNVLIDINTLVSVNILLTNWDEYQVWKEF